MANTRSAKKAVRSSAKKRTHNLFWTKKIKESVKALKKSLITKGADADILKEKLVTLQKAVDKASKEKVIHKNKANRLKSTYAKKITALNQKAKTSGKGKSSKE